MVKSKAEYIRLGDLWKESQRKKLDISFENLRYYIRIGLIVGIRRNPAYKIYDRKESISRLRKIIKLRAQHYGLEEIRARLENQKEP